MDQQETVQPKKEIQKEKLEKTDIPLLKILSNNARSQVTELTKKVNMPPETIRYRIKRLEQSGLIRGYSCLIDLNKLGYSWYIVLLSLNHLTTKEESMIKTLFKNNKKVWFVEKGIGKWNLRMEVLAKDTKDFQQTLRIVREKLQEHLSDFELVLIFQEYINERFPKQIEEDLLSSELPE